jgi:hypothetical protein
VCRKQSCSRAVVFKTCNNCTIKLRDICIYLINNGDFIRILTCCLLNVTYFLCEYRQRSRLRTAYGVGGSVYLTLPDDGSPAPKHVVVCNKTVVLDLYVLFGRIISALFIYDIFVTGTP